MATLCGVCNTNAFKYHCPTCSLTYCSVDCFKDHRSTHAAEPADAKHRRKPSSLPPISSPLVDATALDYPRQVLSLSSLETSQELQKLLARFPRLRAQLREVYVATIQPLDESLDSTTGGSSSFGRGSHRGRRDGGTRDRRKPALWSQQKGYRLGLQQLQRLKEAQGNEGAGLREFSRLVTDTIGEPNMTPASGQKNERPQ